jgi:hypothetical protein
VAVNGRVCAYRIVPEPRAHPARGIIIVRDDAVAAVRLSQRLGMT